MVVVVSWILIGYVFISWELTSQIDVSLNWVLVRGYLGNHAIDFGLFVLLGLWRLCVRFNRIHQFSFPFNNYCFTIHSQETTVSKVYKVFFPPHCCLETTETLLSWCLHKKSTIWGLFFVQLHTTSSSSQPVLSKERTIHKEITKKRSIPYNNEKSNPEILLQWFDIINLYIEERKRAFFQSAV